MSPDQAWPAGELGTSLLSGFNLFLLEQQLSGSNLRPRVREVLHSTRRTAKMGSPLHTDEGRCPFASQKSLWEVGPCTHSTPAPCSSDSPCSFLPPHLCLLDLSALFKALDQAQAPPPHQSLPQCPQVGCLPHFPTSLLGAPHSHHTTDSKTAPQKSPGIFLCGCLPTNRPCPSSHQPRGTRGGRAITR